MEVNYNDKTRIKLVATYLVFVLNIIYIVMAQWLACPTRKYKVAGSRPTTAMWSLGDWFTQPKLSIWHDEMAEVSEYEISEYSLLVFNHQTSYLALR
jgi:hypothetical protein